MIGVSYFIYMYTVVGFFGRENGQCTISSRFFIGFIITSFQQWKWLQWSVQCLVVQLFQCYHSNCSVGFDIGFVCLQTIYRSVCSNCHGLLTVLSTDVEPGCFQLPTTIKKTQFITIITIVYEILYSYSLCRLFVIRFQYNKTSPIVNQHPSNKKLPTICNMSSACLNPCSAFNRNTIRSCPSKDPWITSDASITAHLMSMIPKDTLCNKPRRHSIALGNAVWNIKWFLNQMSYFFLKSEVFKYLCTKMMDQIHGL